MDPKLLVLSIPSLAALILAIWHMAVFRSKKTAFYFVLTGLLFGFFRAKIIYLVQVIANKSIIPYQFSNKVLKIGNDSLQVYLGWILAAYLSWCIAEYLLKSLSGKLNDKELSIKILPIVSISFLVITGICYASETSASFMKWWHWNQFLSSEATKSLFVNVPWVGMIDWGSVVFEFLAGFFLIRYAFISKKWAYLAILALPVLHWSSHLSFGGLNLGSITPSYIWHWFMFLIPVILFFIKSPELDEDLSLKVNDQTALKNNLMVWGMFFIIFGVNFFSDLLLGKNWIYLISLIPLLLLFIMSLNKVGFEPIFIASSASLLIFIFLPLDILTKKRLTVSFYPVLYIALLLLFVNVKEWLAGYDIKKKSIIIFSGICIAAVVITGIVILPNLLSGLNFDLGTSTIPQKKAKVILITIDTLRSDHLGAYGYKRKTSPNLDKFANQSVVFDNAYTPIPYTVPAHLSLLHGIYPKKFKTSENVVRNVNVPGKGLAQVYKESGYKTAGFVSFQNLTSKEFQKGFDVLDFPYKFSSQPKVQKTTRVKSEEELILRRQRKAVDTNVKAFNWLDKNNKDDFFLWVHYFEPHSPYTSYRFSGKFSKGLRPKNAILTDTKTTLFTSFQVKLVKEDFDFLEARYDEEILTVDYYFGALINKLKALGIYKDATIIVVGDHGENFDHKSVFHGTNVYESAIKVPLLVKSPFLKPQRVKTPASLLDIYPTLNSIFELNQDSDKIDGLDLQQIIEDKPERDLFFETKAKKSIKGNDYIRKKAVLRDGKKLIATNSYNQLELFNVLTDKEEIKNTSASNIETKISLLDKIKSFFPFTKHDLNPDLLK